MKFRWRIQHGVYDAAAEVEVLCHNIVNKGVPLPEHWHTAMQCLAVSDIANSSARKVCDARFTDVCCVLLGQAAAKFGSHEKVGQSIALTVNGERIVFLLCAHVENNDWLCHRGSFVEGALAASPFHEHDLVCKDIVKDAWKAAVNKRLRSSGQWAALKSLVGHPPDYSWTQLVAVAHFKAEEMKAARQGIALDVRKTAAGFESNPFLWEADGNWMSQASVTFLWSWAEEAGTHTYDLQHPAAGKVLKRGVPVPNTLREANVDVYNRSWGPTTPQTFSASKPCSQQP